MIGESDRARVLELIGEAMQKGCRKVKACEELGLSVRTVQRLGSEAVRWTLAKARGRCLRIG